MPTAEPITKVKQLGVLLQPYVMERSSPKSDDPLAAWSNFSEKKSAIGRSLDFMACLEDIFLNTGNFFQNFKFQFLLLENKNLSG